MRRKLAEEKSALGYWLSGHLYDAYRDELKGFAPKSLKDIVPGGRAASKMAGIISSVRQVQSKRGPMGIVTIDDGTAVVDLMCFGEVWSKYRRQLTPDAVVCVTGRARYDEFSKRLSVSLDDVMTVDKFRVGHCRFMEVDVKSDAAKQELADVKSICAGYAKAGTEGVQIALRLRTKASEGLVFVPMEAAQTEELAGKLREQRAVAHVRFIY